MLKDIKPLGWVLGTSSGLKAHILIFVHELYMTACSTTCLQLDMFDMYCCAHHCLKTLFWKKEKGLTFFEIASCDRSHACQSLQVRLPVHMTKSFVGASFVIGPRAPCVDMVIPLVTGFHTHKKPFGALFNQCDGDLKNWLTHC